MDQPAPLGSGFKVAAAQRQVGGRTSSIDIVWVVCIKPVMHTMDKEVVRPLQRRREHSAEFKRDLVARSLQPGISVAASAMDNGSSPLSSMCGASCG